MFCKLILHTSHVSSSFTNSNGFRVGSVGFLGRRAAYLSVRTVLCCRVAVRAVMLILFLVFMGMCLRSSDKSQERTRVPVVYRGGDTTQLEQETESEPGKEEMTVYVQVCYGRCLWRQRELSSTSEGTTECLP